MKARFSLAPPATFSFAVQFRDHQGYRDITEIYKNEENVNRTPQRLLWNAYRTPLSYSEVHEGAHRFKEAADLLSQTFSFPRRRRYCQASNCPDNEKRTDTCALVKEDPCSTRD
jgi:hypothetical protein